MTLPGHGWGFPLTLSLARQGGGVIASLLEHSSVLGSSAFHGNRDPLCELSLGQTQWAEGHLLLC